jgi:hypothetical protein
MALGSCYVILMSVCGRMSTYLLEKEMKNRCINFVKPCLPVIFMTWDFVESLGLLITSNKAIAMSESA